ncbi:hypothetical protein SEUCBS139899_001496 [Sporothrix eucalyptigena]|uniref:Protein phosphatase 4 core regulatory subunit R2 n=1 Tax=Sporothrix eucalyptigena TaxID=1812306 RepID=A0ABP0BKD5_9PEZI
MDVDTDEELLHRLAAGGTINYDHWPRLLANIISRLETIVESEYPIPIIPPPRRTQSKLPQPPLPGRANSTNGVDVASSSRASVTNPATSSNAESRPEGEGDKENADPASGEVTARHAEGRNDNATDAAANDTAANGTAANGTASPSSASAAQPAASDTTTAAVVAQRLPEMPKPILELVDYIKTTLKTTFAKYPPHSIQRLAELILSPRDHYRYLAPYLHAVDRVISVTSCSNIYPLPPAVPSREAMALLAAGVTPSAGSDLENGDGEVDMTGTGLALAANPAGDNSLGALLTPIPWLRRRTPSAVGDDNTTDDGSSPPSTADGSDIAFSTSGSTTGSVRGAGGAGASRASSLLQQQSQTSASSSQQLLQQQGHPPQHRMEVRTEATETIEGPNGMGNIETVSVSINGIPSHGAMLAAVQLQQQRGITQGELLRQEQTAGVVPVTQLARAAAARAAASGMGGFGDRFLGGHDDEDDEEEDDEENEMDEDEDDDMLRHAHGHTPVVPSNADASHLNEQHANAEDTAMGGTDTEAAADDEKKDNTGDNSKEDDEEIPHARGPQEIGAADMGPQRASSRTAAREGSSGSLLIGSAADASQVDMRDIDVEVAVGRKASALPAGTVAAPVVPLSSRESVRESGSEDESVPAEQRARSTTPKREADQDLESEVPAKKRKEDHDGDEKEGDASAEAPDLKDEPTDKTADDKDAADKPAEASTSVSPKKDDEAPAGT